LVVDDESSIRESLRMILEFEGYRVFEAESGPVALDEVARQDPDALILDIKMPEMSGFDVLKTLRSRGYDMPILVISGHADVAMALEATREGAYDFFEKPLERDRVLLSLRNAVESSRLQRENKALRQEPDELIGDSPAMCRLRETIERAAPTPATVLIVGESGTGKELVARALHRGSPRSSAAMVQVNCAAIPDELIESELFGHERGSFTGAVKKQVGKFVAADQGTIFLDEIGDMSPRTQAKVLRVLQSGEVEPVGSEKVARVDVRVIAATHRNLKTEIAEGRFREDLFYRLNVVPIRTPPLRERLEDVPTLVEYFIRRCSQTGHYPAKRLAPNALEELMRWPWKGNVRELKNLVERLLILGRREVVGRAELLTIAGGVGEELPATLLSARSLRDFREQSERLFLIHKLEENAWNVTRTAEEIATPRSNLYKKMDQYGIKRQPGEPESSPGEGDEIVD
jgi:two-component system nitrogen regulation response regulator NtrX